MIAEDAARSLLAWWADAGVVSPEAEAILALAPPAAAPAGQALQAAPSAGAKSAPKPIAAKSGARKAVDPAATARTAAAAATTLEALEAAIRAYDGCDLKKSAASTVVFDGRRDAPVLVICDAPSRDDDAAGKPLAGQAGALFDRMMAAIGLSRGESLLLTPVVYWRPIGARAPDTTAIAQCLPFVQRTLELLQPKAVIVVGGVASTVILGAKETPLKLSGQEFTINFSGLTTPINAMVMVQPDYLLHRPQDKAFAWEGLLSLESWLNRLGVPRGAPI